MECLNGWLEPQVEAGAVVQQAKPPSAASAAHMGASSCSATFLIQLCLWPGKTVEDRSSAWALATKWETWEKLLASYWPRSCLCSHMGSVSAGGRPFC